MRAFAAAAAVALVACAAVSARALKCNNPNMTGLIVIGHSAGLSQIEQGASEGLRAAIAEASQLTTLRLHLQPYSHDTEEDLLKNVKRLALEDCAFLIATSTGTSATEPALLGNLSAYGVPLVGTQSASQKLRSVADYAALFSRTGSATTLKLPLVVNVRASGRDELDAVLSVISQNWATLSSVSYVGHKMLYDQDSMDYVDKALRVLIGNSSGVLSHTFLGQGERLSSADLKRGEAELFSRGVPRAIIVSTTPNTTGQVVAMIANSTRADVHDIAMYFVSWVSPEDLDVRLTSDVQAKLARKRISMYFTQNMPWPSASDSLDDISLLRKFNALSLQHKTHAALEGYLTGWFIYEVLQQTIARNGLDVTPGDFLYTTFVDVRTFNVLGMTLGPYGDGGLSGGTDTQAASEACNQGVHEVFMSQYFYTNKSQAQMSGATMRFAGCTSPSWSDNGSVTLVATVDTPDTEVDDSVRIGVLGAANSHNSAGENVVLLRSLQGDIGAVSGQLGGKGGVVAVANPQLHNASDIDLLKGLAVISPLPGLWDLHYPIKRDIIHLFPSSKDEAVAAVRFFQSKPAVTKVKMKIQSGHDLNYAYAGEAPVQGKVAEYIRQNKDLSGFFVLGGVFNVAEVEGIMAYRLLNSQVVSPPGAEVVHDESLKNVTYRVMVSPPLVKFSTSSALRTEFTKWVAGAEANDAAFQSFFVGKFLAQVIDVAKGTTPNKTLMASDIINAVYKQSVFTIGGVQVGPFRDSCSGDSHQCCNQGLDTVYIVRGIIGQNASRTYSDISDHGRDYMPFDKIQSDDHLSLILGLAIGLGGAAMLCVLVLTLVVWRTRRTVEFFNIRKTEIELGKCLGQGRFGSMYMADWHGTTVAVRVIDKKATPKEDQRLIKEEVLLLHKHHHPNLLMLMGYCETRNELLVVTEYMEGGTLADYLVREKRYATVYSLVAMAFDVVKGIAYLHSCKPPIIHGSICTRNLLLDAKGTVKVSDFWFSTKRGAFSSGGGKTLKKAAWQPPEVIAGTLLTPAADVYAFGIVLWELIAPPEMTLVASSSASASTSVSGSPSVHSISAEGPGSMLSVGCGVEMQRSPQLGPPEMPPNATPEVADLLERCWQSQPERRPSIFQILRSWPSTFSSLGAFEVPPDLNPPSANAGQPANAADLSDEMAASMMSIMPHKLDADALQCATPKARRNKDHAAHAAHHDA
eukprot:m51a1_g8831 putative flag-tagged protein kinase domain of mitogen-activated protein kinase kinase kinase (1200) ;mRNA; r:392364-396865